MHLVGVVTSIAARFRLSDVALHSRVSAPPAFAEGSVRCAVPGPLASIAIHLTCAVPAGAQYRKFAIDPSLAVCYACFHAMEARDTGESHQSRQR